MGLGGCIAVNLGILFLFKYYVFAAASVEKAFGLFHISLRMPAFDVLLPVGISFYTFQALGYVLDVWRGRFRRRGISCAMPCLCRFSPSWWPGRSSAARTL